MKSLELVFGILMLPTGAAMLWAGTFGRDWNNTHGKSFQRVELVSPRMQRVNNVAALVGGVITIAVGVLLIVLGLQ